MEELIMPGDVAAKGHITSDTELTEGENRVSPPVSEMGRLVANLGARNLMTNSKGKNLDEQAEELRKIVDNNTFQANGFMDFINKQNNSLSDDAKLLGKVMDDGIGNGAFRPSESTDVYKILGFFDDKHKKEQRRNAEELKQRIIDEKKYEENQRNMNEAFKIIEEKLKEYAHDKLGVSEDVWDEMMVGAYKKGTPERELAVKKAIQSKTVANEAIAIRMNKDFKDGVHDLSDAIVKGEPQSEIDKKAKELDKFIDNRLNRKDLNQELIGRFNEKNELKERVVRRLLDEKDGTNQLLLNNKKAFDKLLEVITKVK